MFAMFYAFRTSVEPPTRKHVHQIVTHPVSTQSRLYELVEGAGATGTQDNIVVQIHWKRRITSLRVSELPTVSFVTLKLSIVSFFTCVLALEMPLNRLGHLA